MNLNWFTSFLLSLEKIEPTSAFLSILSVAFWGYVLFRFHPEENKRKLYIVVIALFLGFISTRIILSLHPVLWPEVNFKPKKISVLKQTAYIAFIQAGVMEETFKILLIMIQGFFMSFSWKHKKWDKNIVLIGGFVGLGFSLIENYIYINKDNQSTMNLIVIFIGRTIYSSNIHMLINICFSLFLIKSNYLTSGYEKFKMILFAFFLAVLQHGVVDFFLLPSSRFGNWLAAALFVGIWVWVAKDLRKYVYSVNVIVEDTIDEEKNEDEPEPPIEEKKIESKSSKSEYDPFPGYSSN